MKTPREQLDTVTATVEQLAAELDGLERRHRLLAVAVVATAVLVATLYAGMRFGNVR